MQNFLLFITLISFTTITASDSDREKIDPVLEVLFCDPNNSKPRTVQELIVVLGKTKKKKSKKSNSKQAFFNNQYFFLKHTPNY